MLSRVVVRVSPVTGMCEHSLSRDVCPACQVGRDDSGGDKRKRTDASMELDDMLSVMRQARDEGPSTRVYAFANEARYAAEAIGRPHIIRVAQWGGAERGGVTRHYGPFDHMIAVDKAAEMRSKHERDGYELTLLPLFSSDEFDDEHFLKS